VETRGIGCESRRHAQWPKWAGAVSTTYLSLKEARMAKAQDTKKDSKKQPTKTLKEKREAKKAKKTTKGPK